jgi:3',5'-cyclic-nucleotide phosphodiesterase
VELRSHRGDHPLVVAGRRETVDALRAHYFNDVIWPDFTAIPLPDGPALELQVLELESVTSIEHLRVRAIPVNHSVPACGFIVGDGRSSVAYTGDTGPTDRFWSALEDVEDLRAVITEVSFPNRLAELGRISKHLVPLTFRDEIAKFRNRRDVPVLICHLKSVFEEEIKAELLALELESVRVLSLGETLQF